MQNKSVVKIINIVLKAIGVAMSVAVVVLNSLNQITEKSSLTMLGIGLFCISCSLLSNKK